MGERTTKTKAELLAMLAEAVRNTQPQPPIGAAQSDPILDVQSKLKRPVSKRTTKTKNARASARRKERRR